MASKSKKVSTRAVGIGSLKVEDWQTSNDLSTLLEACKIKKDPKRMKAAQALAKSRLSEMAVISAGDEV